MLVEFSVENFRSIKTLQTLSMQATSQKESDYHELNSKRIHSPKKNLNLVKTKAIFGANASGKSNLVRSMAAFWKIIDRSLADDSALSKYISSFRLDKNTFDKPSYFQIIVEVGGVLYRYGFEADNEKIHSEWLFAKNKKEIEYFIRDKQKLVSFNKTGFSEIKEVLNKKNTLFKENTLILSVLNALNGSISTSIYDSIVSQIMINGGEVRSQNLFWKNYAINLFKNNNKFKEFVINLLAATDRTIDGFEIAKDVNIEIDGYKESFNTDLLFVKRKYLGHPYFFNLESEEGKGTQKIFALSSSFFEALNFGKTLIIDEFDSTLHPDLTREVVRLFQSKDAHDKAQLIFVSHDSNLLDSGLIRRDQITFVEKNKSGETEIYDLSDIKGVRDNDLFEKNYLKGKYGAMPTLNNFKNKVFHG